MGRTFGIKERTTRSVGCAEALLLPIKAIAKWFRKEEQAVPSSKAERNCATQAPFVLEIDSTLSGAGRQGLDGPHPRQAGLDVSHQRHERHDHLAQEGLRRHCRSPALPPEGRQRPPIASPTKV
ncbi:hypothetical protein T484DRAFT_1758160 [Baffinella frigidus]|nr:hypothetical protein T484DRAFT_1758160 [Cryptophyta sp. CCMP2293]